MSQLLNSSRYPQHLARHRAVARASAERILPFLRQVLPYDSYLDVGCGTGTWLAVAKEQGVGELMGADGAWLDKDSFELDADQFRVVDVTTPLDLQKRFDLISCLEVASDVPAEFEDVLLESLARHGDAILFSSAAKTQRHKTHVNRRWQSHWVDRFSDLGFQTFDIVRPHFWPDSDIGAHYRQNCILFARNEAAEKIAAAIAEQKLSDSFPLDVVHPEIAPRPVEEYSLKVLLKATLNAIRRRLKNAGGRKTA